MTWLVWRQYRTSAAATFALLVTFGALLPVTGLRMAAQWHSVLLACTAAGNCATTAPQETYLGSPAIQILVLLTLGVARRG
jgi:hypothetical protein